MNAPQTSSMDNQYDAVLAIIDRAANGEITLDEAAALIFNTIGRDNAFQLALGILEKLDKQ